MCLRARYRPIPCIHTESYHVSRKGARAGVQTSRLFIFSSLCEYGLIVAVCIRGCQVHRRHGVHNCSLSAILLRATAGWSQPIFFTPTFSFSSQGL